MNSYSGRFLLRIDPALHKELAKRARKGRISINGLCGMLLKQSLRAQEEIAWWMEGCNRVVRVLKEHFGEELVGVALFGSQIQGNATEESDLDMLIVLKADVSIRRGLYRWWDRNIKWDEAVELSPQFVSLPEDLEDAGGIWFEMAMSSYVLWERGRALTSLIAQLKRYIAEDNVRRYWANGQPYWVRRQDEEQGSRQGLYQARG